jgi:hypothetical protein
VQTSFSSLRWTLLIAALTLATFVVQGYHPLAEDGGLYVAGVEFTLNPRLFPHYTQFVSEHLRFSIFAPVLSAIIRFTRLPMLFVILLADLASIALTLAAARSVLRRIFISERAQLAGTAMLGALWTLPIAGTSLLLMDPYVTARSLSTPLSLWAIALALDSWKRRRSLAGCIAALALAAAFHPLMAGYALGFILVLRILRSPKRIPLLFVLGLLALLGTTLLQAHAPADSPAVVLASKSRYYWFLSQWHWYEIFGLIGPFLILLPHLRFNRARLRTPGVTLCIAAILYGSFATLLALLFAHESYPSHLVARLQPLRVFLMIYIIMVLLLGAGLQQLLESAFARLSSPRLQRCSSYTVAVTVLIAALVMYVSQRRQFPASSHIELPWRVHKNPNPWVQAFLWCRDNTPVDALFALDAHYITTSGEDAQTFRATAERSAVPDFSKDGGEASITPRLADQWLTGFTAQLKLSSLDEHTLRSRFAPLGVTWLVLRSSSPAALECPYDNGEIKVCKL